MPVQRASALAVFVRITQNVRGAKRSVACVAPGRACRLLRNYDWLAAIPLGSRLCLFLQATLSNNDHHENGYRSNQQNRKAGQGESSNNAPTAIIPIASIESGFATPSSHETSTAFTV